MTIENINKPNPQHYKVELKNVPAVVNGQEVVVDSIQLETRHILKDIVDYVRNMMNRQLILKR